MDRVISRNQRTLDCTRGADGSCHQSQSTHLGLYSRSRWIVSSVAINAPWIVLEEPMDRVRGAADGLREYIRRARRRRGQKHFLT